MKETDIIIIGAGCSGTSLAHYLETEGFSGKIDIYDSRTKFDRDQRWCSWGKMPDSFKPVIKHSWHKWAVCDKRDQIIKSSGKHTYSEIYAPDFFKHFHSKWTESSSKTQIHLGEKITEIKQKEGFVEVETNCGKSRAKLVFDARNNGSKNIESLKSTKSVYLHQTFLGWKVKFKKPVFDPETVTLMDFSVRQTIDLSFIYILPYSETEALVESTCFGETPLGWEVHFTNVEDYLSEKFGNDYEILGEESGNLPMTTAQINPKPGENIYAIGIAGGHARPSSGYAFYRIQRHTQQIAKAIVAGKPIPLNFSAKKYDFYDGVFLQAIRMKPEIAHEFFMKLFAKVSSESLIRFLVDESSFGDDFKVVKAMPKVDFLKAFLKNILNKLNFTKYVGNKISRPKRNLRDSVDNFASRPVVRDVHR
jgi:lycopene beta-cyclase